MNRLSHMMFALTLFVALYSLVFAYSVWSSDFGRLSEFVSYYLVGGVILSIITVPIIYHRAPHKDVATRTTSNLGAVSALSFIAFAVGSLGGSLYYLWKSAIPLIGGLSLPLGAIVTMTGALVPDWDIPLLGISKHRNLIFHSAVLPLLITLATLINVAISIVTSYFISIGIHFEYYVAGLFLLGYASHLYLDIFPSDASPLEILWRASDPYSKAPTGLKPFGPIKISRKAARGWLVGNATLLLMIVFALMGLYFYNLFTVPAP